MHGLFHRAVVQSGGGVSVALPDDLANVSKALAETLGCEPTAAATLPSLEAFNCSARRRTSRRIRDRMTVGRGVLASTPRLDCLRGRDLIRAVPAALPSAGLVPHSRRWHFLWRTDESAVG